MLPVHSLHVIQTIIIIIMIIIQVGLPKELFVPSPKLPDKIVDVRGMFSI